MDFSPYPFQLLNDLIKDIGSIDGTLKLTIGEPQFDTPKFITDELIDSANLLNKYPSSNGESYLVDAQVNFLHRRFGVNISNDSVIPTFGTRECLFNFPCFFFRFLRPSSRGKMAFPNPFYQIYEGSAIASNADILYMDLDSSNHFKQHLTTEKLEEVDLVILNSPNNPTGSALTIDELEEWVRLALKYNFVILSDECYSEIYVSCKPHSILEACMRVGNDEFHNVLCVNSLSKRSSSPGLRSGFIAGDKRILAKYRTYRTYVGVSIPLPLQRAACVAWNDDIECDYFRRQYAVNIVKATEILGINPSPYTFYLWLNVGDDLQFTKRLYANENILVLPGRFLGRNGAGEGFVRIALVYENKIISDALERLKKWI